MYVSDSTDNNYYKYTNILLSKYKNLMVTLYYKLLINLIRNIYANLLEPNLNSQLFSDLIS